MLAPLTVGQTFPVDEITPNGRLRLVPCEVIAFANGVATLRKPDGTVATLVDSE